MQIYLQIIFLKFCIIKNEFEIFLKNTHKKEGGSCGGNGALGSAPPLFTE